MEDLLVHQNCLFTDFLHQVLELELQHLVFFYYLVFKILRLGLPRQVVYHAQSFSFFFHLLPNLRNMAIEVRYDVFAFLHLSTCNLYMSGFELGLLVVVVAGHIFEFLSHVVRTHVPIRILSELVSIKLVVHLVIYGLLL